MYLQGTVRLLVLFVVAFSLTTVPGTLSSSFHLSKIHVAWAATGVNNPWLPGGPAMDRLITPIFTDQVAEFNNLQQGNPPGSGSVIDLTDQQLTPNLVSPLSSASQFVVTSSIREHGYFEIQFDLSNTFWNCDFLFGNSTCGIHIRQGIAHLIDRSAFVTNDPNILNTAVAIDNPVPIDNGGLTTPSTCGWDILYAQTTKCIVGSTDPTLSTYTGGSAFHLASAGSTSTGAQPNPSLDFCAAAGHFLAAGVATGVANAPTVSSGVWWRQQPSAWTISTSTSCVLTGVNSGTQPNFFVQKDDVRRLDLGDMLAAQICLLFTGSSVWPCANLSGPHGFITTFPFPGIFTSPTTLQNNWWIYTAEYVGVYPFDNSLYHTYNSRFVSGFPSIQGTTPGHSCSTLSVGSYRAANYMYLCDTTYDKITNQIESANCLRSSLNNDVDTQAGATTPTFRDCMGNSVPPDSSALTSLGAGFEAQDRFGRGAYTMPVFDSLSQYGYLNNGFVRVVNSNPGVASTNGAGISSFYSWLDAWNPSPPQPGTIRQGFRGTTVSINPYEASTAHDYYILGNIYDRLGRVNPYKPDQLFNWMTVNTNLVCSSTAQCVNGLTYSPPPATVATYRFTLRSDMFFHDGKQVASFDVAFTYLSLLATGAFPSADAASLLRITLLSPMQFDFNLGSNGPTELLYLMSLSIMPGRYWTGAGSAAWDSASTACAASISCFPAQYSVNSTLVGPNGFPTVVCNSGTGLTNCPFSANNMNVNASQTTFGYDPLASGTLIGSGPWMCISPTGVRGQGCSATGRQNPDASTSGYTLTRFGTGHAPGSSLTDSYFRSSGNLGLWFWSGNTGDFSRDFLNFGVAARCVGAAIGTASCTQWQQGIWWRDEWFTNDRPADSSGQYCGQVCGCGHGLCSC